MVLKSELAKRNLPDILTMANKEPVTKENWERRRHELVKILENEIYGRTPASPESVWGEEVSVDENAFAGKATYSVISICFDTLKGVFKFPVNLVVPNGIEKPKLFVFINFRPEVPDQYLPSEELVDGSFAVASFCYTDVVSDDDDFENGLSGMYIEGERAPDAWGKISMWAWAASRVLDVILHMRSFDRDGIAIIGHSRLGKTALWCAARDTRFQYAISNCSGCSGAALSRGKIGETIEKIYSSFPYWFCPNYQKYAGKEYEAPFDQHFLLAASAPRKVYVASAKEDSWADPESEFLSCIAASEVYSMLGMNGFVSPDRLPWVGDTFHDGNIGYHLRTGTHYLSRYDWNAFMAYMNS